MIWCPFISVLGDLHVSLTSQVSSHMVSLISSLRNIISCQDKNTCRWKSLIITWHQSQNPIVYLILHVAHWLIWDWGRGLEIVNCTVLGGSDDSLVPRIVEFAIAKGQEHKITQFRELVRQWGRLSHCDCIMHSFGRTETVDCTVHSYGRIETVDCIWSNSRTETGLTIDWDCTICSGCLTS